MGVTRIGAVDIDLADIFRVAARGDKDLTLSILLLEVLVGERGAR